jgi:AcrR family transcriptional regulator
MFLMENPVTLARRRDAAATRERLIGAAFEEIYRTGYQGSDINSILTRAGVTKGALYHHFGSKEALGHAVIEHLIAGVMTAKWLAPLDDTDDPISALIGVIAGTSLGDLEVSGGCPLNNLAQEMSPIDEGFRVRLSRIFTGWIGGIADALRLGQANGVVRRNIDPREAATFIVATYEGYLSLAKNAQAPGLIQSGIRQLTTYLEGLRP